MWPVLSMMNARRSPWDWASSASSSCSSTSTIHGVFRVGQVTRDQLLQGIAFRGDTDDAFQWLDKAVQ